MKPLTFLMACAITGSLWAQPFNQFTAMKYQGVARDATGTPIANQLISLRLTVTFGVAYAYEETQSVTTNDQGLFSVALGQGTPTGSGTFATYSEINWNGAVFWSLLVAADFSGGTNYQLLGSDQLLAVPFANMANEAQIMADSVWVTTPFSPYVWAPEGISVGIGTNAPTSNFDVRGNVRIVDGTEADGSVLMSDGDGNATWGTLGAGAIVQGGAFAAPDFECASILGESPLTNSGRYVSASGAHAYAISSNPPSLSVVDISDPADPTELSTIAIGPGFPDVAAGLALSENTLCTSAGDELVLMDISVPSSPTLLTNYSISPNANIRDVVVKGDIVFVLWNSTVSADLAVTAVNISAPASPSFVGFSVIDTEFGFGMAQSGDYLYVRTGGTNDLVVVDISDPSSPSTSGTFNIQGSEYVAANGDHIYSTDPGISGTLYVYDISTPTSPSLDGSVPLASGGYGLAAVGNYVVVTEILGQVIEIVDVSDPSTPVVAETIFNMGVSGAFRCGVYVHNGSAIVANNGTNDLQVVRLSCPQNVSVDPVSGTFSSMPGDWQRNGNNISSSVSGNVGVGTDDPAAKLHALINASPGASILERTGLFLDNSAQDGTFPFSPNDVALVFGENGIPKQAITGATYANDHMRFYTGADFTNSRIAITAAGSVGIGTDSPTATLSVDGTANNSTGSWGVFSDSRIKDIQGRFTDGLNVIEQLQPIVFSYNDAAPVSSKDKQIGVVAQELKKVAPYMVSTSEFGSMKDMHEVDNQAYVFLLINAIKEQQDMIRSLQQDKEQLNARLISQQALIEANTALLSSLQEQLGLSGSR